MQTSIDLPSPLGVIQTSSITSTGKILSPDQQNNLKDAVKRSEEDKLFRKQNQMNDMEEFEAMEVQNGDQKSLIYYYKALKFDEEIQQNELQINNIVQIRSKLGMIEGFLMKKSPHWFQGYSQRNCILRNRVFRYYDSENKKVQGVLNFDVQSFQLQELQDKNGNTVEFILKPLGQTQKVFQFKGGTVDQTKTWVQLIKQHLQDSIGALKVLKSLSTYEYFWRFERISSLQIMEDAEDGDILLFQGKDINCHIQRTLTQANFDHVGILIRLNDNQLYLFEALPLHGVGLCRWNKFIICKWNYLYHKVIYRKLQVNRDENFISRMHEFVTENIGKQYSFNPTKLFKFKSTMLQDPQQQQTRTFFSSELVAACYKHLNLLSKDISSTQYSPGSFSSENQKLSLRYGSLSEEYLIDFEGE
ncbi:unnamed protein product (macronuclear) [Paramecium tetraurelia]|uniref:PH domain-containing protein n=1 Tax=Paramecium tetraurelia TaxID=5888 RepID=A0CUJ8_PARTE|nr:uncharacterized protein GSPATT00010665001 [Paramecium tetraurelia]CAK74465.1 unnamed protein product [Paramecium tetraurelia]|eukprot:XP_001441862.1 hypothetical protein (macronuclear) [Paramecium tetraurelia strain d4-2]